MPATAGRVRMPANNRVHSSAALQTHGIWQSAIGYDPYAPSKEESKGTQAKASVAEPEGGENSYASFQGLLALARITNTNTDVARGACPKCGRVGHLKYQCRNFLSIKDEKEKDLSGVLAHSRLGSVNRSGGKSKGKRIEDEDVSEEEKESSDSDVDPEMERLIAERFGKKESKMGSITKKKQDSVSDSESDDSREKRRKKKRGRSVKRSGKRGGGSDSDEDDIKHKKSKREKRKKMIESSEDEKECRRRGRKSRKEKRRLKSHKESESDDSADRKHKRRSKRADSTSESSYSDDARIGRHKKRSEKRSRKRQQEDVD